MISRLYRKIFNIRLTGNDLVTALNEGDTDKIAEYLEAAANDVKLDPTLFPTVQNFLMQMISMLCQQKKGDEEAEKRLVSLASMILSVSNISLRAANKNQNDYVRDIVELANNHGHPALSQLLIRRLQNHAFPLIQAANPEVQNKTVDALNFLRAARDDHFAVVDQYLKNNINHSAAINVIDAITGNTALIFAAIQGHNTIVIRLLKAASIDLFVRNKKQNTARMEAVLQNHVDILFSISLAEMTMQKKDGINKQHSDYKNYVNCLQQTLDNLVEPVDIPQEFICPISFQIMQDPVETDPQVIIAKHGQVFTPICYDRSSLGFLFKINGNPETVKCPHTKKMMLCSILKKPGNAALKDKIECFVNEAVARDQQLLTASGMPGSPVNQQGMFASTVSARKASIEPLFSTGRFGL